MEGSRTCPLRKDVIGLSLRRSRFVVASWVGRWSVVMGDGSFVLGDRGDENFGGSCAENQKLSTGRSFNSCVDCKISISVTSRL